MIREPKDFGEAFRSLGQLWRQHGPLGFLWVCFTLGEKPSALNKWWSASIVVLAASTAFVLYMLITVGHAAFNTSTLGITWGLPIAVYLFFVLTSTGLTFVASLAMIFGVEEYYAIAKRCVWLALVTLVAGFTSLTLELGHPFRMLWSVPTGLQYRSPMFWMGVFYSAYMALLLLKFAKISFGDWHSRASRSLGIASFVTVVVAHGTLGMVFGMMAMRPMWYDGMLSIYFLTTAALSGAAFAVLFTYMAHGFSHNRMPARLRAFMGGDMKPKVFATAIGMVILITVSRTAAGLWSNLDGLQVYALQVRSPEFLLEFWGGLVLPFALMLAPSLRRQAGMQIFSAMLVVASLFFGRLGFVVNGQVVPMFKGSWVHGLIEYTPSVTEWAIALVSISMTLAFYALGEKVFNLSDAPAAHTEVEEAAAELVRI